VLIIASFLGLSSDVWVALVLAVTAIWVARWIPIVLKNALWWPVKKVGGGFKSAWKHFVTMESAKANPTAAVAYVARELAILIMYATFTIVILGAIGTAQVVDPAWQGQYHLWLVVIGSLFVVVSGYRGGLIILLLMIFCEMINNPPKAAAGQPASTVPLKPPDAK
jgi:hypothetical protein